MRTLAPLLALLIVLSGVAPAAAAASVDDRPGETAPLSQVDQRGEPVASLGTISTGETVFRASLTDEGDARWSVEVQYALASANDTAAFREYAQQFEGGETDGGLSVVMFERAAAGAETVTGREMTIQNVSRDASVENDTGTLELSFVWTNFLERPAPDQYRLGDAFRSPGNGTWLRSLSVGQRLVVETPEDYTVNTTSIRVLQRNRSIIITGPHSFRDDRLRVTYQRTETTEQQELPIDLLTGGGIVLLVAALIVAGVLLYRRREEGAEAAETGAGAGADTPTPSSPTDGGTTTDAPADGPASDPAPDDESGDSSGEEDDVDVELLSDEERVERLVERNGGRMKQAHIVRDTGWSDAKVSQLLSSMADDGRVEKLRLGRENLISLPDDEGDEDDGRENGRDEGDEDDEGDGDGLAGGLR